MPSRLLLTLAILAAALGGCDRQAGGGAQASGALAEGSGAKAEAPVSGVIDDSLAGSAMPELVLRDPDGRELDLASLRGQPVLVNLWATWCVPCIKEMPLLDDLAGDLEGRLRVLTVSQDLRGAEVVVPFFAERGYANLEPWLDPQGEVGGAIGDAVMPTTVLYDSEGRELWRVRGDYDWSSAEARAAIDGVI